MAATIAKITGAPHNPAVNFKMRIYQKTCLKGLKFCLIRFNLFIIPITGFFAAIKSIIISKSVILLSLSGI